MELNPIRLTTLTFTYITHAPCFHFNKALKTAQKKRAEKNPLFKLAHMRNMILLMEGALLYAFCRKAYSEVITFPSVREQKVRTNMELRFKHMLTVTRPVKLADRLQVQNSRQRTKSGRRQPHSHHSDLEGTSPLETNTSITH